ncbi:O-antigen ligase family protein [Synechococcus sp. ATX 2A4]|uniref:O-antigen ligase family protein n=1 Tax=Synechococcus sp. ATX 2A4 TaxID=2823727 RepID=UPI0020CC1374|nr:O-antigen ligase family protein [Synechococcus sp. ATX 2A4]MCP9885501.1 O-antigen ligase family protein [Synechococcus sp. ATX 2A4]
MRLPVHRLDSARPETAPPLGWRCFQLGMFMLPSSALIAGLLLLVALVAASRRGRFLQDNANRVLLVVAALMVIGCFRATSGWLAWVGMGNWLPFFWAFWGFQSYVATATARRRVGLWLLAGTVPVIVTGLGQLWWGWAGPLQILGGAIIWHIGEGGTPDGRLSGLFDYANIAGSWLAVAWPFALAALLQASQSWQRRSAALGLAALLAASLYLTDSRNAWGALVLAVPIVGGPRSWLWLLPLLLLALLPVALSVLPGVPLLLQGPARALVPEAIWGRLTDLQHASERPLAITRLSQWGVALSLIAERPLLGWGAAAFSVIYPLRTGFWHGHPHNLPIDLALSHGLPAALLLVGLLLGLLIMAARRGMAAGALFERAWWGATLVLVALHATDMPLYDSRLNIAGWVLFAGIRAYLLPAAAKASTAAAGAPNGASLRPE